jgi:hypothetical protein
LLLFSLSQDWPPLSALSPPPGKNIKPAMSSPRSFLARASVLTMVVLRTCHGFYVPGVRPYEFAPGEEVPMKVNALTSIHTQVRMRLALCEALTLLGVTLYGLFICLPSHHDRFPCSCALNLITTAKPIITRSPKIITVSPFAAPPADLKWPPKIWANS